MRSFVAQDGVSGRLAHTARPSAGGPQAHLLGRFIFSALLALFALTAVPYGTVEPWWEAAFECGVFALTALWAIEGALSGGWLRREHRLLMPLLALVAFALLQTLPLRGGEEAAGVSAWRSVSADPFETRLFALKLLAVTLACGLLLRYTSSRRRLRALILAVVLVGLASAFFGIVRQTTQRDAPGFILAHLGPGVGYGQYVNRSHFAFLMEMVLGLILGLVVGGGVRRGRVLICLAAAAPLWTALVLANSRGGILGMLVQIPFAILLFMCVRPSAEADGRDGARGDSGLARLRGSLILRAVLAAGLFTAVVGGMLWMGGEPLMLRLETVSGELGAAERDVARTGVGRAEIWRATLAIARDNPVAGVGFGGYWTAVTAHHDASGELTPQQAHNDYLELLASGGIVGASIGLWFIISFVRLARERLKSVDRFRRAACLGALTGLFGVAIHSFFDFGLHVTANALTCIALIAVAVADDRAASPAVSAQPRPDLRPAL